MATKPDIIVTDQEKFPLVAQWGKLIGGNLGLEYYELDDEFFDYIPQHINFLRFSNQQGTYGKNLWGEVRSQKSSYNAEPIEDDDGNSIQIKEKEAVDSNIVSTHVKPFMEAVITLKVQEVFEKRYNVLRTKYSTLEDATWDDQLSESKAYIADNSTSVKLIDKLAEVRGLTTADFAAKVVQAQDDWKTKLYDLAVEEQKVIAKLKSSANVADINVFLEDYFGEELTKQQCLDYGRCIENESGVIVRKDGQEPKYGTQF